jgi:type I restriction enzyme M protein
MDKDRPTVEFIIIEVKKVDLKDGKKQLRSYCNFTGTPIGVWSNGGAEEFYHRKDPNYFDKLLELPKAHQKLADVIGEKLYLADLTRLDAEKSESQTLRSLIMEMEDEVLTYDGVDVFDEGFKLNLCQTF